MEKNVYTRVQLKHFAVEQKLTQNYTSTILQLKKTKMPRMFSHSLQPQAKTDYIDG